LSGFLRVDLVATDDFQEPAALAEDASARSIRPHADASNHLVSEDAVRIHRQPSRQAMALADATG